ncbi:hypothetical protein [Kitasatospora griseola]|uniref:hypothetical protein n=1 Tax=Kitasatospora griseola TaxID=2064 RepID=UPI003412FC6C
METLSRVLRWAGALFVVAAAVQTFMSVGDDCGSVVQPNSMRVASMCSVVLADQQSTVVVLGTAGLALLLTGQVVNWRTRRA